ncbi:unnamed protein product [Schistosoma mattheei]|uniref:Uncharacterized protein n=1 Tax=Schistosoma mattheei TaxID=31246 RepID=A0A3P8KDI1_9TREM|nr:unnamed protein product [Schistosoma mattheei]
MTSRNNNHLTSLFSILQCSRSSIRSRRAICPINLRMIFFSRYKKNKT